MEVVGEDVVSIADAKVIMKDRGKEKELTYEQKICLEYIEKVCKISPAKIKEMVDELSKIAILKPRYIALIVNMMPDTVDEVKALFSKEITTLKKNELEQIASIVKKYK